MDDGHRQRSSKRPVPRGGSAALAAGRVVCLTALAVVLLASVLAQAADAGAPGFSFTPSKTEPYAVCGRATPGHAECLAILVPSASAAAASTALKPASAAIVSPSFSGSGVGGGYAPADLRSAYDLPSASSGSGQTVAVVDAYDDPDAESDLATYRSRYGISACTTANGCFKKVNQSGGTTPPSANAGWAVEISVDLDMVSAACPNCHILLVEASSNANSSLNTAEDEAVSLGATEISNSWGGPESSDETSEDSYFHHAGVTITVAAGDSGYEVEYPAASPYVIAVGGTSLTPAANSRGWSETAWSDTGSGCSSYEPKPTWQTDTGCPRRTNNDVAAVANPETPVSFADSYQLPSEFSKPEPGWSLVGGTSVASPFIAGTMALANAYTRSFPGAEALYAEAAQNGTGVLDDVTSGSDGTCGSYLCDAGPGYDAPTGLGSPYGAPVVLSTAPSVVTDAASSLTQTAATLNATVNPNGASVSECRFEYGTTISYGSTASCSSLPGSGSSPVAVTAPVGGLAADTVYHFRISATNAGGTSKGSDQTFTTLPNPPTVVTQADASVTQTTATLDATVNPNGATVSQCKFEYGSTSSYGSSAPCSSLPGSGSSPVSVSAAITGLTANSTYHFRISATNSSGTSQGSDETLKTTPLPTTPPAVETGAPSSPTQTTATLNATVNPNGATVSRCEFEYGPTTSYGSSAACSSLPGSGSGPVSVSAAVAGLAANTTYHVRISATNAGGTTQGSDQTFTTLPNPPTVVTQVATSVTQTTSTLEATVNPNGANVSECKFEYGSTTSYGSSATCASLPASGSSPVAVSAVVTGLSADTTYHFRISATNASGTIKGTDETLKTLPNPPTAVTQVATSVTQTTATLDATVNPNGANVSECKFEYGSTTSYGSSAACSSLPGAGSSPVSVSAAVTGLSANSTYHFRISATNSSGTRQGADEPLKTSLVPATPPTVVTGAASSLTQTAATLNATVNPNGAEVSECRFEYGTTTSYGSSAACSSLPGSGSGAVDVSAAVGSLSEATTYHFRIVAADAGGTSYGVDQTLATLLPTTLPPTTLPQSPAAPESTPASVLPPASEQKAPTADAPTVPDARLASASLEASPSGAVGVGVSCPTGASSCTGMVMLRTVNAVNAKKHKAVVLTLASHSFSASGGRVTELTMHLSAQAVRLLARARVLRVRATIVAHDPAGAVHTTEMTVTLRARKAARPRR